MNTTLQVEEIMISICEFIMRIMQGIRSVSECGQAYDVEGHLAHYNDNWHFPSIKEEMVAYTIHT